MAILKLRDIQVPSRATLWDDSGVNYHRFSATYDSFAITGMSLDTVSNILTVTGYDDSITVSIEDTAYEEDQWDLYSDKGYSFQIAMEFPTQTGHSYAYLMNYNYDQWRRGTKVVLSASFGNTSALLTAAQIDAIIQGTCTIIISRTCRLYASEWDYGVNQEYPLVVNTAPTVPVITFPSLPSYDKSISISWISTDSNGDTRLYDVDYSSDGGSTWTPILTASSALSIVWDTQAIADGTNYKIRIRAKDPYEYSNYSYTSIFSIIHSFGKKILGVQQPKKIIGSVAMKVMGSS